MEKPWTLEMARAMLTLKKDTLPPVDAEGLDRMISLLLFIPAVTQVQKKMFYYCRKKLLAWYDGLGAHVSALGIPEAALLARAQALCHACREPDQQADAEDTAFQAALLQAVADYRAQVEIPASGDAVIHLNVSIPLKKEILETLRLPISRYFFDPGVHKTEIAEAFVQLGGAPAKVNEDCRRDAFHIVLGYLQEQAPWAYLTLHMEYWPEGLEWVLTRERMGYSDEFLLSLMPVSRHYLEMSKFNSERAKAEFDQAVTQIFLNWTVEFKNFEG